MSSNNERKRDWVVFITLISAIIVAFAALIPIVQYFTGKPTFPSLFDFGQTATAVTQATPIQTPTFTPTPSLSPTFTPVPASRSSPFALFTQSSFTPIPYNSFWTWFWWTVVGFIIGFLVMLGVYLKTNSSGFRRTLLASGYLGGVTSVILSYVSSFLINYLQFPSGFLISVGAGGGSTLIMYIISIMIIYKLVYSHIHPLHLE